MITVSAYKVGNWTAKKVESEIEKAIEAQKLAVRYLLTGICGTHYTVYDNEERTNFIIKGDKHWDSWKKEHRGEWLTDF